MDGMTPATGALDSHCSTHKSKRMRQAALIFITNHNNPKLRSILAHCLPHAEPFTACQPAEHLKLSIFNSAKGQS